MSKLSDLAERPDLQLGPMLVSPSRRLVRGPTGRASLEPLIMQAFLLLLDARGKVVTRDELFDRVWGGVIVGDDSLNRAIAKVRRIAAEVAPGLFEIETIPRTGYRLTGEIVSYPDAAAEPSSEPGAKPSMSRRIVIGGVAAAAGLAGIGLWTVRSREDRQFHDLMARGKQTLLYGDPLRPASLYLQKAVALRPRDAGAQGLFAYSLARRAEYRDAGEAGSVLLQAERAARAALAIDPNEPNARLALLGLRRSTMDFATTEDRYREVLEAAPDNTFAMRHLWSLLQSVGRSRDSLAMIERAIAIEPLAAANNFPRAQLLWILGRTAEADRMIDQAMDYWPEHQFVRFARFTILAFTGRPRAALAMIENPETRPQQYTEEAVALWRISLAALDQPTPSNVAAARRANLEVAKRNPALSNQGFLVLSRLGEVDAAFEIANELFLFRQPVDRGPGPSAKQPMVRSDGWRFAPWLFTPPGAAVRADARFKALCDGIGLTDYWEKQGIKPDYQLGLT
jgi:DNA-binding winged helix-turn-helix (wHTH) protein